MLTLVFAQTVFDEEAIVSEDFLVSVCAGLVAVDRESHVIRLVHYTTQDYFERKGKEMFPDIQLDIAKACLNYLLFDDFESDEITHGKDRIEIIDELRPRYPFLEYAGKYWGRHAHGNAEYSLCDEMNRLLEKELSWTLACDLIDDSFGYWNFGLMPTLTVFVYFGLERTIGSLPDFDKSRCPTCAIRIRNDTRVFLLVEPGATWHDSGKDSMTVACSSFKLEGNETMVELLAEKGANIDFGVDNGEFLFWCMADTENCVPTLLALLRLGATVDPKHINSWTPLTVAVIYNDELDVQTVLWHGANVNEKDERGRDALTYAALARNEIAVKQLFDAGADVHSRDGSGMTPLCAACKGGNVKIVKLLLESGANLLVQDKSGRTPAAIASEGGHYEVLAFLRNPAIDDHSEDEVEDEVEREDMAVRRNAAIEALVHFYRQDHEIGSPGHKHVEYIHREAVRRGYDKAVQAFANEYFKRNLPDNGSNSVEEEEEEEEPGLSKLESLL